MNTGTTRNSILGIVALIGMLAVSGCSQKTSSEEIAAQVKAALAEEKAKEHAATPVPVAEAAATKSAAKTRSVAQAKRDHAEQVLPAKKIVCANCGVVISVKELELAGKGTGLGAIAGGVTGGLVGNQVGQGTGRDLATVAGLVGGAFAGNMIEQKMKKTKVYDVTVQMDNGEERVLRDKTAPGVIAGDKVKVESGHVVRQ